MQVSLKDRDVLRRLAERWAAIAARPEQKAVAGQWRRLNRLQRGKPMVWINEVCWPEMGDELALQTAGPFCRRIEEEMRQTLYQWDHMRADMVVDPWFPCYIVTSSTGYGIAAEERTISHGAVSSHGYIPVIREESDVQKIRTPVLTVDEQATQDNLQTMERCFGDILPVRRTGRCLVRLAPWDALVQWWGAEQAMMDLVMRPEMVHRAVERLVRAELAVLDQKEKLGLLPLNNGNCRVGAGGLGFTEMLPQKDYDGTHVRPKDLWGAAQAQIFCGVSPEMHEEFALKYEMLWLKRFGLNCYGCCEPLHHKVHILEKIPNLRRISMSPLADVEKGAAAIGAKYVFSHKPNPAVLAGDAWNPAAARKNLREALEKARGCIVEIIMKDISTVRNEPQRLWDWARIAMEVAEEFA